MIPDAFFVLLLALNALSLSVAVFAASRSWRYARLSAHSSAMARIDRNDARKYAVEAKAHAERLDLPRILPFRLPMRPGA